MSTEVSALASTIRGTAPMAPELTAEQRQLDADMEKKKKSDGKMAGEAEAQ